MNNCKYTHLIFWPLQYEHCQQIVNLEVEREDEDIVKLLCKEPDSQSTQCTELVKLDANHQQMKMRDESKSVAQVNGINLFNPAVTTSSEFNGITPGAKAFIQEYTDLMN